MAAASQVQALLRFLTKDAKLPLQDAMSKIHPLRKLDLSTPEAISKADADSLKPIFSDEKVLKQVINAAKRVSNPKKRQASESSSPASKRARAGPDADNDESLLALPTTDLSVEDLQHLIVETNRAPLFLAFTISVLAYTHPEQPLSSRWSMAQAVVSAGAQSKAKYLGLTTGPTAEEDGWAMGQPKIKIMGREVAVMRRQVVSPDGDTATPVEAFWGLDLDALRKSNGPLIPAQSDKGGNVGPPIYKPAAPRSYLLRSMVLIDGAVKDDADQKPTGKSKEEKHATAAKKREHAAGVMLKAIDTVCQSWASFLTKEELDARAQSWYMRVRPEVEQGQAGWGQRGQVKLQDILRLRKD
ncbi:hypothetical protein B0A52_09929 [Exophiala mesophila]|uniref:Impact N-terminal domain-containing protein n=1 Tax=Exophiala mesophila TaxID=212818 RepID=A0A438MSG7_EXOME|nr:hypothetical protein B0A52_09929 [Exophiala mesophila]